MSLLTLDGFEPPARYEPEDAIFLQARIERADVPTGPWVTIEPNFTLTPAITDPAYPPIYSFTSDGAPDGPGWFRVVWIDSLSAEEESEPLQIRPLSPYAPSVGMVALLVTARLVEEGGTRVETFTQRTNPTAGRVSDMIAMYAPMVLARTGDLATLACVAFTDVQDAVKALIAQRVALEVELSYFPEEVDLSSSGSVDARRGAWTEDMTAIITAVEGCRASGADDGGDSVGRADPAWRFPRLPRLRY